MPGNGPVADGLESFAAMLAILVLFPVLLVGGWILGFAFIANFLSSRPKTALFAMILWMSMGIGLLLGADALHWLEIQSVLPKDWRWSSQSVFD